MAPYVLNINENVVYIIYFLLTLITLFSASWSTNEVYDYDTGVANQTTGVLGDIAYLPCNTRPLNNNNSTIDAIVWFHSVRKSSKPICSYDNRNRTGEGRYWCDKEFSFRFNENEVFSVLTLKPVKLSHQGSYRCRVDFRSSPTRNYIVNLTVITPPRKLSIIDEKGIEIPNTLNNVIGPYNEGSTALISCVASEGSPPPKVTWWKENALLDDSSELLQNGMVKNVLKLEKLTRAHLNAVYTCQANNNNVSVPLSTTVTISMSLSPLWIKLQGTNKPMSAGRIYEISCQVYGANPSPVITWWKGNTKLKNYEKSDSNDGNSTISRLNFIPEYEDDGKLLICRADGPSPSSTLFQDWWKLNITYKPIATLELGKNLNASAIVEGIDVYFECKIKSNLPVHKITWKQDGRLLRSNQSLGLLITNQELVLQKVSRSQSGLYSCMASNLEGDGESNSTYLNIKFAPTCYHSAVEEYGVGRGENIRITCEMEANPAEDVKFVWRFGNMSENTDLFLKQVSNGTRSFAEFQPKSEYDYGILSCWARNSLGETKQPCSYKIFSAGKPDAVTNCVVTNKTFDSLRIKCDSGFDGGSRQRFTLEIRESETDILFKNVSQDIPEFYVTGLHAGLSYDIVLYSANSKGKSRTVEFSETLNELQNEIAQSYFTLDLPPLFILMMILVGVLILLACCLIVTFKSYSGKHSKKQVSYKSKESLEKNPDIIPNKDDVSCTLEVVNINDEKKPNLTKETDISLILQNSYGTDLNSDYTLHHEDCKKMYRKKTASLKRLNEIEITYAACDQPCPPFINQETPLLSNNFIPLMNEGQHSVQCCIHGLSRSTSISRF